MAASFSGHVKKIVANASQAARLLALAALWLTSCQTAPDSPPGRATAGQGMTIEEYERAQLRALGCVKGEGTSTVAADGGIQASLLPHVPEQPEVPSDRGRMLTLPSQPRLRDSSSVGSSTPTTSPPAAPSARGEPVQRSGGVYHRADGVTGQRVGGIILNSDGTTGQVIGGSMFTR